MSDRKFVRNALRLEASHKGVKESAYVRKSWNELIFGILGLALVCWFNMDAIMLATGR